MLTKTRNRDDIVQFDALVSEYERRSGVPVGAIEFLIPGETAEALEKCFEIVSHPRVFSMIGASTHGDVQHVLGYEWTAGGEETLYYRSRVLLASRAAGIEHPTSGCFESEDDVDGLIFDAQCARRLGYRGYLTPFASHTAHVNRVFTPSDEEIARLQAMIDGYEAAIAEGLSSYTFEGRFTDLAHVKSAREQLAFASSVGALVA
jgi:citrate lyase subunit beta/citryl-CoA lyase